MGINMTQRRDGGGIRRERMQRMHNMLKDGGDVSLERFLATVSYQIGLTDRTAMTYLKKLETLGFIEIDESLGIVREVVKE